MLTKLKLRKLLKELELARGRHTELISVYIPAGYRLEEIINQLRGEEATAENIKSKTTRKNVIAALEKIINHLKQFRETPSNGLVVFCGNVSQVEGKTDVRLWSLEPVEKLTTKIYWCDQEFVLEPLKEMVREKDVFGLIVLDAREADVGVLRGKSIEVLKHLESLVPGKFIKGGQSQRRFQRVREGLLHDFLKKVAEESKLLLQEPNLKGILIGGPGPVKERFAKEGYLHYQLQQKVLAVKDTGYTGNEGLEELLRRSWDVLEELEVMREKKLVEKFFAELHRDGLALYGLRKTLEALRQGKVDTLLLSEEFRAYQIGFKCKCGFSSTQEIEEKDLPLKCEKCGAELQETWKKPLQEVLEEEVKNYGTRLVLISTETQEGLQFAGFGIGALLRYK